MIKNYINGELVEPVSEKYFDNFEPAIGQAYDIVPDSDERDVELAVKASEAAFPLWSNTPVVERSKYMKKVVALIERDLAEFARAECIDNGKPLTLAKTVDIPRAVKNFEFFASAIHGFASESHQMEDTAINYTLRSPIGVVGAISPWNLPLYLFTWKIAPALITGNCVVAKPSEITPMTAHLLAEACIEAGLPAGVLNIVHGYGGKVGSAIVKHPDIKAITFTGGTKTGKEIASVAAPMFKKLSLELGGKNPNIIFADCNYEKMLGTTLLSSFRNQGEICLCGSRIFIEKPIYEKFRKDFVEQTKLLKVGDPLQADTDQGAVVSKEHMEKVLSYIQLAKDEGGTILTGGNKVVPEGRCKNGWFIEPTIIEGLPYNCRTNQEEIFGPVVTLIPFETEDEALRMANSTEYGLASIIWTENLSRAHRMAAKIQSGIVWINCWMVRDLRTPFGGMKSSGVGREGGMEALRFFTEAKNVCVRL
ncbi:MAG: aldehyde dehydrogenase [Ignavibacteria bacterium]|nr:aldehyde dehydrogenase [Ignavibacteria bacterium]